MFPHIIPVTMPYLSELFLPHLCRKDMEEWGCPRRLGAGKPCPVDAAWVL